MIYDPILDKNCIVTKEENNIEWNAKWIWFPGQLTAHLLANRIWESMIRCKNVSFPGNFRNPEYIAYFRKKLILNCDTEIHWNCPISRTRVFINGNLQCITQKSNMLQAGQTEIYVIIDFSRTLPAIILQGENVSTDSTWEVSLDGLSWVAAECEPSMSVPSKYPDIPTYDIVKIPPAKIINTGATKIGAEKYTLSSGDRLIIDFVHNEIGELCFTVNGKGALSVSVAQSLPEAENEDEKYHEQYPLENISMCGKEMLYISPKRCIRYAIIKCTGECNIYDIFFNALMTPVEYKGSFECSDPFLNDIWSVGAATIHTCMHDFYLDGINRDALPWAHDAAIIIEAADCVFFNSTIARHTMISQTLPANPTSEDLGIIDFSLYVPICFERDFMVRGDKNFIDRYIARIYDILSLYQSIQDEKGFINAQNLPGNTFLPDWTINNTMAPDIKGTPSYAQMLLMHCFEIGSFFANSVNNSQKAAEYRNCAENLRRTITEFFWDAEQGAFVNGYDKFGNLDKKVSVYAQVFGILYDLVPHAQWNNLLQKLEVSGARAENISLHTYWELLAYIKAGRTGQALDFIRDNWGSMLKRGYTKFFEDIRTQDDDLKCLEFYDRLYGNNLSHGWAGAVPVTATARGVLGINPTKEGFTQCIIKPDLYSLVWAKGSVPTPYGNIYIEINKLSNGKLILPEKVEAILNNCTTIDGLKVLNGPGEFIIVFNK